MWGSKNSRYIVTDFIIRIKPVVHPHCRMQFTPQQLAGAGRYQHKTRIGNWNEDAALEEVRC